MASATIKIDVQYDPPNPQPNPPVPVGPASAEDGIGDTGNSSLSGSGSSSGASTDKTVPAPNGTDQTQQTTPVPAGAKFREATVTMTLNCPNEPLRTLTLTGNVSVSGRVEGNCIVVTAVNQETVNGRTIKTTTKTRKRCCGDKAAAAEGENSLLFVRQELAELRELLTTGRQSGGVPQILTKPRRWFGLSLRGGGESALEVAHIMNGCAASEAGLRVGDRIMEVAGRKVSNIAELVGRLAAAPAGRAVALGIVRGSRKQRIAVRPTTRLFRGNDVPGDVIEDKKCDAACNCTVNSPGAVCASYWAYRGDGPNGGVLYDLSCTAFGPNLEVVSEKECGLGEYI